MAFYLKVAVFIVATSGLVWLSRGSITNVRHHGFYRFLAYEAILALVLLNINGWFDDWLSYRQIISWVLLALSVYLVTHGTVSLYRSGKPSHSRDDATLVGIEKTTELVTTGIYRYIRHPIYSAAVIGVWGVVLKDVSVAGISLAVVTVILMTVTAKREEAENIHYFGDEYARYMKRTRMFVPLLF